ncbi:MAG: hypothetical protein HXK63_00710 [Campylobacter sp.]|nr:hypothetical protein [Campylobacter sp.]
MQCARSAPSLILTFRANLIPASLRRDGAALLALHTQEQACAAPHCALYGVRREVICRDVFMPQCVRTPHEHVAENSKFHRIVRTGMSRI